MTFPEITDFHNAKQYADVVGMQYDVGTNLEKGGIYVANDSRFTAGAYNQALTTFAVGGWNKLQLDDEIRAYVGTPVQVSKRFSYKVWANAEAFKSETTDDLRAIGADFKAVNYTNTEVETQVANRGLIMVLDKDELQDGVITEQMAVQMLSQRLKINQLRRISALAIAAASSAVATWSSGSADPDLDVLTELNTAQLASGLSPNTVIYERTTWTNRVSRLRAAASAGAFATSQLSEAELAGFLGVDQVYRTNSLYQSASATKTRVGAGVVLLLNKSMSAMKEDPSNIKYFWSPTDQGGQVSAFRYEEGSKRVIVGVQHNELLAVVSSTGLRKITIS
jgi:hypothetical protein